MKISRRQLKNIILKEFKDTSRPVEVESPTIYDQLSNSERNNFIQAMSVIEKSSGNKRITESIFKFPNRNIPSVEMPEEAEIYDLHPQEEEVEETDPTDPSQEEIKLMSNMMNKDSTDLPSEDDLDQIFGIHLAELERRKKEEEENERLGVPTLRSVSKYFYDDDEY